MSVFNLLRPYVEQLYTGTCSIWQTQNQQGLLNDGTLVCVCRDVPCRIDFDSGGIAQAGNAATEASQTITLLLPPDITVEAGSKAVVTQNGRTTAFYCSGVPVVYVSHQEIPLVTEDRWV